MDTIEKTLKGYIFRMYPTEEQRILIEKSIGTSRFIYNHFLSVSKEEKVSVYEYIKQLPELTKQNPRLKEVDSCLLRTSIFDLDNTYQKYFKEKKDYLNFECKIKIG